MSWFAATGGESCEPNVKVFFLFIRSYNLMSALKRVSRFTVVSFYFLGLLHSGNTRSPVISSVICRSPRVSSYRALKAKGRPLARY